MNLKNLVIGKQYAWKRNGKEIRIRYLGIDCMEIRRYEYLSPDGRWVFLHGIVIHGSQVRPLEFDEEFGQ